MGFIIAKNVTTHNNNIQEYKILRSATSNNIYIYIYIYKQRERDTLGVILSNVALSNNLLLNSYFENSTVELYVPYVLNIYTNFHANQM